MFTHSFFEDDKSYLSVLFIFYTRELSEDLYKLYRRKY